MRNLLKTTISRLGFTSLGPHLSALGPETSCGSFSRLPAELLIKIWHHAGRGDSRLETLIWGMTPAQVEMSLFSKSFRTMAKHELSQGVFNFNLADLRKAMSIPDETRASTYLSNPDNALAALQSWTVSDADSADVWMVARQRSLSCNASNDLREEIYSILSHLATWVDEEKNMCHRLKHVICPNRINGAGSPLATLDPIYWAGFNPDLITIVDSRNAEVHDVSLHRPIFSGLMPARLSAYSLSEIVEVPALSDLEWRSAHSSMTWIVPQTGEKWRRDPLEWGKDTERQLEYFGNSLPQTEEGSQREIVFRSWDGTSQKDVIKLLTVSAESVGKRLGQKGYIYRLDSPELGEEE